MWDISKIYKYLSLTVQRSIRGKIIEADNVPLESQSSMLFMSAKKIPDGEAFAVLSILSGEGDRSVQLNTKELDEFANLVRRMQRIVRENAV